jgi:hypothetical protein
MPCGAKVFALPIVNGGTACRQRETSGKTAPTYNPSSNVYFNVFLFERYGFNSIMDLNFEILFLLAQVPNMKLLFFPIQW